MTIAHVQVRHVVVALAAAFALTGCMAPGLETEAEATGEVDEDLTTSNALTSNSLTSNSLTSNSLTSNSLTSNSLTSSVLSSNTLVQAALTDPNSRAVLKYIVGCALPAGEHVDLTVDGVAYRYDGELGLASAWSGSYGTCDTKCRTAVSACVLARVNYLGQPVPISMRGAHLPTTAMEVATYTRMDGAYYGNIFATPQIRYACLPPGKTTLDRVCGPTLTGCVVTAMGSCNQVCGTIQRDGSYPSCQDNQGNGWTTVTVYLQ